MPGDLIIVSTLWLGASSWLQCVHFINPTSRLGLIWLLMHIWFYPAQTTFTPLCTVRNGCGIIRELLIGTATISMCSKMGCLWLSTWGHFLFFISANHDTLQVLSAATGGMETREMVVAAVGSPPPQAALPALLFRLGMTSTGGAVGASQGQQLVSPCPRVMVKDAETFLHQLTKQLSLKPFV